MVYALQVPADSRLYRSSACVGNETHLAQCFRHQLLSGIYHARKHQPQTPCRQQLIIACADPIMSRSSNDRTPGPTPQQPTWVVGDRSSAHRPLGFWSEHYPKQFSDVLPRKCQAPPELLQRVTPRAWSGVPSAEVDCIWGHCWGTVCSDHEPGKH
jgi:hypothetical protein